MGLRVELEQSSDAWLNWRKTGIGGSDSSKILGENPYSSRYDLWLEKTGKKAGPKMNAAMQKGIDLEPFARAAYEALTGTPMPAACYQDGIHLASLDGISFCGNVMLEIKCPGYKTHSIAMRGEIPGLYMAQLQHNMMVSGATIAHYYSYFEGEGVLIVIDRDDAYIENLRKEERHFWDEVVSGSAPAADDTDYIFIEEDEFAQAADKYKSASAILKMAKEKEAEAKAELLSYTDDGNCTGAGLRITRVVRKGAIDWEKVKAELDIADDTVETFRKCESTFWKITEIK